MRELWRSLVAVLSLLLIGGAILYALFALMFWEPDRAKPGSLAYFLAIPSVAKNFPILNSCGMPTYSYRFQDGLSPETYWIDYETRLPLAELRTTIEALATSRKCKKLSKAPSSSADTNTRTILKCRMEARVMQVTVSQVDAEVGECRPVSILFTEDL